MKGVVSQPQLHFTSRDLSMLWPFITLLPLIRYHSRPAPLWRRNSDQRRGHSRLPFSKQWEETNWKRHLDCFTPRVELVISSDCVLNQTNYDCCHLTPTHLHQQLCLVPLLDPASINYFQMRNLQVSSNLALHSSVAEWWVFPVSSASLYLPCLWATESNKTSFLANIDNQYYK